MESDELYEGAENTDPLRDAEESGEAETETPPSGQGTDASQELDFDKVVTDKFVVNEIHYDDDRLTALRIHTKTVLRLRQLFYRPPGYEKALAQAFQSNERILVVHGREHSGKLTCAVNLACDLRGRNGHESQIYLYRRRSDEARSLLEVVQSEQVRQSSALILEDAFQTNLSRRELQSPDIDTLRGAARDRDLILIMTSDLDHVDLQPLSVTKVATKGLHLEKVLEKHLTSARLQTGGLLNEELAARILGRWADLKMALRSPSQIERFCEKVVESPPQNDGEIDRLARQAALVGRRALREWFGGLGINEKLFALLAYLFAGTERSVLEEMHSTAIRMLRAEGLVRLDDPRELGFEDLLDAVQAQELDGLIELKDRSFEEELVQQAASWAKLLWSIMDGLLAAVRPDASPESRRALGVALGRLSAHQGARFEETIESLAGQRSARIAVIAGSALEERVRQNLEMQGPQAAKRLRGWIRSGDPERMWAAGAAVRRIYAATKGVPPELTESAVALQRDLTHLLGQLIGKSDNFNAEAKRRIESEIREKLKAQGKEPEADKKLFAEHVQKRLWGLGKANRDCAAEAAQKICLMDPSRSRLLEEWFREKEKVTREVARDTAMAVFEALTNSRSKPGEARHAPFLALVKPVLESVGQGKNDALLVEQMFAAFASWLSWTEWRKPLFSTLLDVANRGSDAVRQKLRAALSRLWLGGTAEARMIAQAVIARSYSMDGVLMDRPRFGKGALVIDPEVLKAGDEENRRQRAHACRHLFGLLESQMDVTLVHLGTRQTTPAPDATHFPVPRLLMPALNAVGLQDLRLVLVLGQEVIWDLEDALDQPWGKNLLLIATREGAVSEGVDVIRVCEDFGWADLVDIEMRLQERWAEALATAGPQDWLVTLESFGSSGQDALSFLNRSVTGLGEIGNATGHDDLARRLLCVICWYAASDLEGCADHLRSWMAEQDCRSWMGAAGAKALFRIHGAHCPSIDNPAPRILFETLAHPLARTGEDGAQAVLQAARRWMQDPVWADYLAGGVEEGRGRLLRWAEEFVPQHVETLKAALPKAPEIPEGLADDAREEIAALLDRLRLWIARGSAKVLPGLEAGESYALVILDASEPDAQARKDLASLAGKLFSRLSRRNEYGIKPIVYRLGETQPCWIAGDPQPPEDVLLPKQPDPPRLLGPILSDGMLPESVRFLLVLSNRLPLDADDWVETDWRERIFLWTSSSTEDGHPVFAALPEFAEPERDLSIERFLLQTRFEVNHARN